MRKFNLIFTLLVFTFMMPKVYAFTYELETVVPSVEVGEGSETEIKVSLKNISGTDLGIASCSLRMEFDETVVLNPKVRSLGNWTLTKGELYLFDTGDVAIDKSEMFIIPLKVNGNGSVRISDIECSDGETIAKSENVSVNFKINKDADKETEIKSSNCDLAGITLNSGSIDFDPDVTSYELEVADFESLQVEALLADNRATYEIMKTDNKEIIINVLAVDGSSKKYLISVKETNENKTTNKGSNNKYVPIFIGIIAVLILINIFRIVKNRSK